MAGAKGRSGRPRKSIELKIHQGTYRPDREPAAPGGASGRAGARAVSPRAAKKGVKRKKWAVPVELTPEAVREWNRLTELMRGEGRLTEMDYAMWVELWVEYGRMKACGSAVGREFVGSKEQEYGDPYEYVLPEYTIHKDARTAFLTLANLFGLSPRSRLSVGAPIEATKSAPSSGMAEFFGG